ncbi:hypothetical protein JHK85_000440 [Glycine max]|nr:hypothetical protein JHK85_000440 [Glycine max]
MSTILIVLFSSIQNNEQRNVGEFLSSITYPFLTHKKSLSDLAMPLQFARKLAKEYIGKYRSS